MKNTGGNKAMAFGMLFKNINYVWHTIILKITIQEYNYFFNFVDTQIFKLQNTKYYILTVLIL